MAARGEKTVADRVQLPPMVEAQRQSWLVLLDVYERLNSGWTLIGGQLVHLHCAERNVVPPRPTTDVDTVLDVRAEPAMLAMFTSS